MFRFLDPTRGSLATIPTDVVVPLRRFDNIPHSEKTIFSTPFLFNGVLDPSKLRASIEILATMKGWEKIGARFRYDVSAPLRFCDNEAYCLNICLIVILEDFADPGLAPQKNGQLHHHIPATFTEDRPAVHYHNIRHAIPIQEHPVASRMHGLCASQKPQIVADVMDFASLWEHPSLPKKLSDFLENDLSHVGLVILSFHDATIVVLRWFHNFFDATGKVELLRAWSKVVNGKLNEIGTPHDANEDPLKDLGLHPTEPYILEKLRLSGFQKMIDTSRIVLHSILKTYRVRVICFPPNLLAEIRRQTESEEMNNDGRTDCQKPFLSDDNLITAWWARLYITTQKNPRGTVNLWSALGLRKTLQEDLLPPSKPYLGNAIGFFTVLIPAQDIIALPLSYVASLLRQRITESRTREQVEAFCALVREKEGTLTSPRFGKGKMMIMLCSSWSSGNFFDLDFTGAVIPKASAAGIPPLRAGFPSYVQYTNNYNARFNLLVNVGKDHEGNYWLNAATDDAHWKRIEQSLADNVSV